MTRPTEAWMFALAERLTQDYPCDGCGATWIDHELRHRDGCPYCSELDQQEKKGT